MNFLSKSLIARITKQVKDQLPQILPEVVSNFAPLVIQKMVIESLEEAILAKGNVYSLKRSRNNKDKDEDPSAGSDRGLKKRKTRKDAEPTKGPNAKESQSGSSKGTKSQPKYSRKSIQLEEPEFEVADSNMPQDQEENLGNDDVEPKEKVASKRPAFRLLKGTRSTYAELEYDFEECYTALSEKLDWENPEGGDYL
ncbi:hypothetical protein Tco_1154245 [Tanacetum coccineum]